MIYALYTALLEHFYGRLSYIIGNHTVKRVVYFLNHINQLVGRCDFLNQPSFRSFHSLHLG